MDLSRRASLLLPLSLLGCKKGGSARAASDEFVDRYYIERDHEKALEVSADGARERVAAEKRLLAENGQGGGAPEGQPHVYYALKQQAPKGDDTEFEYELTIESGGVKLSKDVRLRVRKLADSYKVIFFAEQDLTAR